MAPERYVDLASSKETPLNTFVVQELKWMFRPNVAGRSQHTFTCDLPHCPARICEAVTCVDASLHLDGSNSPQEPPG